MTGASNFVTINLFDNPFFPTSNNLFHQPNHYLHQILSPPVSSDFKADLKIGEGQKVGKCIAVMYVVFYIKYSGHGLY
jgi:hypothetical protein